MKPGNNASQRLIHIDVDLSVTDVHTPDVITIIGEYIGYRILNGTFVVVYEARRYADAANLCFTPYSGVKYLYCDTKLREKWQVVPTRQDKQIEFFESGTSTKKQVEVHRAAGCVKVLYSKNCLIRKINTKEVDTYE